MRRIPTFALALLVVVVACAGDDAGTVTTEPGTTADSTSTSGGDATGESTGDSGTTWAQNVCTKQAIDCFGDGGCESCPDCDEALSGLCGECEKYGSPCGCAAAACAEGHFLDKGHDMIVAGCTACVMHCDPDIPGEAVELPDCTAILDGTI